MGIYDREYVRVGPHSRSGLGSLRFVSVNSWIIIINVAVYVLGGFLAQQAVPVAVRQVVHTPVAPERIVEERTFRTLSGQALDTQGVPAGYGATRLLFDRDSVRQVGNTIIGQPIGSKLYRWMNPLEAWGHMSTYFVIRELQVWRVITFQFLHAGFTHILFNMFGLWVFGGMVEQYLGSRRYLAFYLTCGIAGALSYLLLNAAGAAGLRFFGALMDDERTPMVGASAGVFGVIVAAAYIAPSAMVQLIFPPIPMRLKVLAYAYVGLAAFNLLRGGHNAGGDAAHIGGAIAGFFLIRNAHLLWDFFDVFRDSRRRGVRARGPDGGDVDRILAKVRTQGLASLSEAEKRVLRRAGGG
jgi:membrane associated rhomboid family serine protease